MKKIILINLILRFLFNYHVYYEIKGSMKIVNLHTIMKLFIVRIPDVNKFSIPKILEH